MLLRWRGIRFYIKIFSSSVSLTTSSPLENTTLN